MKKLFILACCLSASFLSAEVGKYQISSNEMSVFLLDTETGDIWMSTRSQNPFQVVYNPWERVESPIEK